MKNLASEKTAENKAVQILSANIMETSTAKYCGVKLWFRN